MLKNYFKIAWRNIIRDLAVHFAQFNWIVHRPCMCAAHLFMGE